jgi:hypothetical protein
VNSVDAHVRRKDCAIEYILKCQSKHARDVAPEKGH